MFATRDDGVLAAGVDPDNAALTRRGVGLRFAVAFDAQQTEIDFAYGPPGIFEGQREVAINSMADLAAFGLYAYRFGDRHLAIFGQANVGIERLDGFGGTGFVVGSVPRGKDEQRQKDTCQCPAQSNEGSRFVSHRG